ncbi:AraC family transcriptional regulator [Stutzerimonas nosocomialis]|uniref:helix-turn-helix transcriptional regulator n=1 Tax=Stutzerimonas nosocomialis TaxID=1056496 RepID=UPI001108102F|nr:helix-turn-helix transcriptional regulator [Stutzerimonas nosocomialis]TLX53422.1 AraC family transcriptional regulator [Stutzerimonas nosocomialis]
MCESDQVIHRDDLPELSPPGLRLLTQGNCCDDRLFEGRLQWLRLRDGLSLHCSDCHELQDFVTENEVGPRMSFALFLEGRSSVRYGERSFSLGAEGPQKAPQGMAVAMAEPVLFRRQARRGSHIRKLVVSLTPDWFDAGGLDALQDRGVLQAFSRSHLQPRQWTPSARLLTLAEQLLHPPGYDPLLQRLYLESRALDIAGEALAALAGSEPSPQGLRPHEHRRLQRLLALLDSGEADDWALDRIAREVGSNANTLQRQFRALKGMTLFEYQRRRKLLQAREALEREGASVAEAAWRAGYTSAANFATAFKRQFGISPRQVRARV